MKIILTEEQLKHIIAEMSTETINTEAKNVNTSPTDPQKEAGNYRMGHISIKGMKISIENPIGSERKFKKEDGSEGSVIMKNHYGYFGGTSGNGKDGDAVDVFIGPNPEGFERVYVIDQNKKDGSFDESKVMLGFDSKEQAKEAYMSNYSPDWKGFRTITGVSLRLFKKWLYRGNKQRKPFSEYVEIQKKKLDEEKGHGPKFTPFSKHDKIELVTNDPTLYDKKGNFKTGGNFPIKRNGEIYWVSRSLVVALYAFCKNENGEWCVLANKRRNGLWNVPQGYLDYGETTKRAAQRECEEETGIKIDISLIRSLGNSESRHLNASVTERFIATLPGTTSNYSNFSTANAENGEVLDIKWIPMSEIDKYYWISHQNSQAKEIFGYSNEIHTENDTDYSDLMNKLNFMAKNGKISPQKYKKIKEILYLNEGKLSDDSKNAIKEILNEYSNEQSVSESFSRYLYHYTTYNSLNKILKYNQFMLSPATETERDNEMNLGYKYFMSFTRQHTNKVGYAASREKSFGALGLNVRIVVNGNLIGSKYRGEPVNYHSKILKNKKNKQQKSIDFNIAKLPEIRQSEDRLLSNDNVIPNASNYIERIDIMVGTNLDGTIQKENLIYLYRIFDKAKKLKTKDNRGVVMPVHKFKNKIFIYNNERDFNFPTLENSIPIETELKTFLDKIKASRKFTKPFIAMAQGQTSLRKSAEIQFRNLSHKEEEKPLADGEAKEIGCAALAFAYVSCGPNPTRQKIEKKASKILTYILKGNIGGDLSEAVNRALIRGGNIFFVNGGFETFIIKTCPFIISHFKENRQLLSNYNIIATNIINAYGFDNSIKKTLTIIKSELNRGNKLILKNFNPI